MWQVVFHPAAETELGRLPPRERVAMLNAVDKLQAAGPVLPFPHQSGVQGVEKLRELRPRAGRSAWRAFYRRIGDAFVIAAVGPEAETDQRGFDRATADAVTRLEDVQVGGDAR
jgi:hypothetical protein